MISVKDKVRGEGKQDQSDYSGRSGAKSLAQIFAQPIHAPSKAKFTLLGINRAAPQRTGCHMMRPSAVTVTAASHRH